MLLKIVITMVLMIMTLHGIDGGNDTDDDGEGDDNDDKMVMIMMTMMIMRMRMIMMKTLTGGSGGSGGLDFQGPTFTMAHVMDIARLKIITSRAIKNNMYINSY